MSDFQLATPVAFIIFNRPDTTERVFSEIARARPPKLLVVGDGARTNREGEAEKVAAARAVIDRVDWPCEVLTNYSDTNLGCKIRVSSGLDWVFEQVPEAIILEDDCLPEPTFFRFCEELLDRYRQDERIGMISGDNFQSGKVWGNSSYYFSKYTHIWGWATWRRAWKMYDVNASIWPVFLTNGFLKNITHSKAEILFWRNIFQSVYANKIDTWDYQLALTFFAQGVISIMPNCNLISNIGFGNNATHTTGTSVYSNIPAIAISFPLNHPTVFLPNLKADARTGFSMFSASKIRYIFSKIRNFLKWK